jgi:hypothetical protein
MFPTMLSSDGRGGGLSHGGCAHYFAMMAVPCDGSQMIHAANTSGHYLPSKNVVVVAAAVVVINYDMGYS